MRHATRTDTEAIPVIDGYALIEAPTDELAVATRPIPWADARCDYCNLRLGAALDEDAMEFEGKLYHRRPCLGHVRLNHYGLVSKELRPWS
jgi:hypothetical protein